MADVKISELTALTSPDGAEELVVNDGGTTKKITITNATSAKANIASPVFTGNVGINTSSAAQKLHVKDGNIQVENTTGSGILKFLNSGNAFIDNKTIGSNTYIRVSDSSDTDTTAITCLSSGNVGIGVVPDSKLHISENTNNSATTGLSNGGLQIENVEATSGSWSQLHLKSSTKDAHLRLLNDGTLKVMTELNANAMSITQKGNVGIGVVPEAWHPVWRATRIGDGASLTGRSDVSSADLGSNFYINATADFKAIDTSGASRHYMYNGAHYFYVDPPSSAGRTISWNTAMTIENDGDVVMGTLASGSTHIKLDGLNNGKIQVGGSGSGSQYRMAFYNSNGQVGNVTTSGSSTSFNTSSDYRLKENVTPMSGATAQTKLLKPCNFDWIAGGNVNGFLAHELAEVVPEAVTGTKDAMRDEEYEVTPAVVDDEGNETTAAVMGTRSVPDMQGIDQSKLVPLLTATIQELIARIEALEA